MKNMNLILAAVICYIIPMLLVCSSNVHAQESTQLQNIIMKFGAKYSQQDGNQLADAILDEDVSAMDGDKYRDYDSMHKLIAKTWSGMTIKYDFISITTSDCVGVVGNAIRVDGRCGRTVHRMSVDPQIPERHGNLGDLINGDGTTVDFYKAGNLPVKD